MWINSLGYELYHHYAFISTFSLEPFKIPFENIYLEKHKSWDIATLSVYLNITFTNKNDHSR